MGQIKLPSLPQYNPKADTKVIPSLQGYFVRRVFPWTVILGFSLMYVAVTLAIHQWDPMSFVNIGGKFDPRISNPSYGYDGQFAYQIAKDPGSGWKYMDVPAYRYQRILYPILARIFSLGRPHLIPWILILINLISIVSGTILMELILLRYQVSRWYALVYGLFIGMLMSLRLDLTEPLAYLLVLAALLTFLNHRFWLSAVCFALAALTRETTLLFAAACTISLVMRSHIRLAIGWGFLAGLPFLAWQIVLKLWLGSWGIGSGGALATPFEILPFHGWWGMAFINQDAFWMMSLLLFPMAILPAIVSIGVGVIALVRDKSSLSAWALFLNAAIFVFLPSSNILDPLGLSRVTIGLIVAILYYGGEQRSFRALRYACLWIFCLVFLFKDSFLPLQ